jgi:hypothetical protein
MITQRKGSKRGQNKRGLFMKVLVRETVKGGHYFAREIRNSIPSDAVTKLLALRDQIAE